MTYQNNQNGQKESGREHSQRENSQKKNPGRQRSDDDGSTRGPGNTNTGPVGT